MVLIPASRSMILRLVYWQSLRMQTHNTSSLADHHSNAIKTRCSKSICLYSKIMVQDSVRSRRWMDNTWGWILNPEWKSWHCLQYIYRRKPLHSMKRSNKNKNKNMRSIFLSAAALQILDFSRVSAAHATYAVYDAP